MVLPGVSLAEGNGARRFGAMGSKMKMGCEIPSGYIPSGYLLQFAMENHHV